MLAMAKVRYLDMNSVRCRCCCCCCKALLLSNISVLFADMLHEQERNSGRANSATRAYAFANNFPHSSRMAPNMFVYTRFAHISCYYCCNVCHPFLATLSAQSRCCVSFHSFIFQVQFYHLSPFFPSFMCEYTCRFFFGCSFFSALVHLNFYLLSLAMHTHTLSSLCLGPENERISASEAEAKRSLNK